MNFKRKATHVNEHHEMQMANIKERLEQVESHLSTLKDQLKDRTFNAHVS